MVAALFRFQFEYNYNTLHHEMKILLILCLWTSGLFLFSSSSYGLDRAIIISPSCDIHNETIENRFLAITSLNWVQALGQYGWKDLSLICDDVDKLPKEFRDFWKGDFNELNVTTLFSTVLEENTLNPEDNVWLGIHVHGNTVMGQDSQPVHLYSDQMVVDESKDYFDAQIVYDFVQQVAQKLEGGLLFFGDESCYGGYCMKGIERKDSSLCLHTAAPEDTVALMPNYMDILPIYLLGNQHIPLLYGDSRDSGSYEWSEKMLERQPSSMQMGDLIAYGIYLDRAKHLLKMNSFGYGLPDALQDLQLGYKSQSQRYSFMSITTNSNFTIEFYRNLKKESKNFSIDINPFEEFFSRYEPSVQKFNELDEMTLRSEEIASIKNHILENPSVKKDFLKSTFYQDYSERVKKGRLDLEILKEIYRNRIIRALESEISETSSVEDFRKGLLREYSYRDVLSQRDANLVDQFLDQREKNIQRYNEKNKSNDQNYDQKIEIEVEKDSDGSIKGSTDEDQQKLDALDEGAFDTMDLYSDLTNALISFERGFSKEPVDEAAFKKTKYYKEAVAKANNVFDPVLTLFTSMIYRTIFSLSQEIDTNKNLDEVVDILGYTFYVPNLLNSENLEQFKRDVTYLNDLPKIIGKKKAQEFVEYLYDLQQEWVTQEILYFSTASVLYTLNRGLMADYFEQSETSCAQFSFAR